MCERRVAALRDLCTDHQWETLRLRFGLDGGVPMSTREIAAQRGCAHQSVEKAIAHVQRKARRQS